MSNSSDPDQAQCSVGPDQAPNCLPKLSVDDKLKIKSFGGPLLESESSSFICNVFKCLLEFLLLFSGFLRNCRRYSEPGINRFNLHRLYL